MTNENLRTSVNDYYLNRASTKDILLQVNEVKAVIDPGTWLAYRFREICQAITTSGTLSMYSWHGFY